MSRHNFYVVTKSTKSGNNIIKSRYNAIKSNENSLIAFRSFTFLFYAYGFTRGFRSNYIINFDPIYKNKYLIFFNYDNPINYFTRHDRPFLKKLSFGF